MMKRTLGSLAIGAIALLLAACIPPYEGPDGGPRVGVMGDSVTRVAELNIGHWLRHNGSRTSFVTEDSATTNSMQNWAGSFAESEPDVMVINLGSNDSLHSGAQAVGELQIMWDKFPASTCQVPVTIADTTGNATFDANASEINDWIYAEFPSDQIADWAEIYANGDVTTNPLHPNEEGKLLMAREIARAVGACL